MSKINRSLRMVPRRDPAASSSSSILFKRDASLHRLSPGFTDGILPSDQLLDEYTLPISTNSTPGASDVDDLMTRFLSGSHELPGFEGPAFNRVEEASDTLADATINEYPCLYHPNLCVDPRVTVGDFDDEEASSPEVSRERFIAAPQAVPASDQPFPSIAPSTPILHHTIPIKAVARRSPCKAAKTSSPIAIPRLTTLVPSLPSIPLPSRSPVEHTETRRSQGASSATVEIGSPGSGAEPGLATIPGPVHTPPAVDLRGQDYWGKPCKNKVRGADRALALMVQNDSRRPDKCGDGCCTLQGVVPSPPGHPEGQPFYCTLCEVGAKWLTFSTTTAAIVHLKRKHLDPLIKSASFIVANPKYEEELAKNPVKPPKEWVFNCPFRSECVGKVGMDRSAISKHCAAHMNLRELCTVCNEWLSNNSSLNKHRDDMHKLGPKGGGDRKNKRTASKSVVDDGTDVDDENGRPRKRARAI